MFEIQEIRIHGKIYPAIFNVVALKEIGTRYGGVEQLGEKLKEDYTKAIGELSWVIALLIQQGTALKNFEEGTSDQPLTQAQVELLMKPGEMFKQQPEIIRIINAGMNTDTNAEPVKDEEVDEVLEEVLKVKNGEGAEDK